MTRNVYLGADLSPALAATSLGQLIAAVTAIWAAAQASDVPGRAERPADEIAAARPDLVGLQEVAVRRSQVPADFVGPDATTVEYDFLALLLDALAARGQECSVVYVCDCNSRADGTGTSTHANTLAAGFRDAWSERHPRDPGFTCCQDADPSNLQSLLDQRLDIVFVRGDAHVRHASVTGDEEGDRRADGLWPSDHAGVVAAVRFRR